MYAVIETGGKQYQVKEGDVVFVEKLDVEAEANITFDKVIVLGNEAGTTVGAPYVDGAKVEAKVLKNGKGKKITVLTYKPRRVPQRRSRDTDSLTHRLELKLSRHNNVV